MSLHCDLIKGVPVLMCVNVCFDNCTLGMCVCVYVAACEVCISAYELCAYEVCASVYA